VTTKDDNVSYLTCQIWKVRMCQSPFYTLYNIPTDCAESDALLESFESGNIFFSFNVAIKKMPLQTELCNVSGSRNKKGGILRCLKK
jgi:hypothetical protein